MTTKTEAASQARKVLQSIKDYLAQPGSEKTNEASTRAHFLNPLLGALGYESIADIQFEHYLPDGKQFLDYRLVINGRPSVSVEAKAIGVNLSSQHAAQVVSYASVLGDEWAVLTNAREWRLYSAHEKAPLSDKLVFTVDLVGWQTDAQFDAVFDQLWLLSKESLASGDGPGSWLKAKQLDRVLRSALTDPKSAEIKYIKKRLDGKGLEVSPEQVAGWMNARITQPEGGAVASSSAPAKRSSVPSKKVDVPSPSGPRYWLLPAGAHHGHAADEHIKAWLTKGFWGLGKNSDGLKGIRLGDHVVFYAAKRKFFMATAVVTGLPTHPVSPTEWPGPDAHSPDVFKLPLGNIQWLSPPVEFDANRRAKLGAFAGKDPSGPWSWYVQGAAKVSPADFKVLTSG